MGRPSLKQQHPLNNNTQFDTNVLMFTTAARSPFKQATNQFEDFEEVQISIQDILYLLQSLLTEGTHGVAHPMEAHAAGEDDEALQQGLAAGYVFQLQVWDAKGKLKNMKNERKSGIFSLLTQGWCLKSRLYVFKKPGMSHS